MQRPLSLMEDQMAICPSCKTEYETGTDSCNVCGSRLFNASTQDQENEDVTDGLELVELVELTNVSQAEMINELLGNNGIKTILRGEVDPIGIASRAEATTILVQKKDFAYAQELYEAYFAGEAADFADDTE
jgi:hypothetical protein